MIKKTHTDVVKYIQSQKNGTKIGICAQIRHDFETGVSLRDFVGQKGFVRYLVDGAIYNLSDEPPQKIIDPWIMVDRVEIDTTDSTQLDRLSQSISTAFEHGEDVVGILHLDE